MVIPRTLTHEEFKNVRVFFASDILREVELARAHDNPGTRPLLEQAGIKIPGAGNILCALALLCYTDFLAGLWARGKGNGKDAFNGFLRTLGKDYETLIDAGHDVYSILRNGFVHNYYAHHSFEAWVYGQQPEWSGISMEPNGVYRIVAEKYAHDLMAAFDRLENELYPS